MVLSFWFILSIDTLKTFGSSKCSDIVWSDCCWHFILLVLLLSPSQSTVALTYYFGLAAAGFVHHPYMVNDSVGKCEFPCGKISYSRISTETYVPLLESPQGHKTYWYGQGLHLWVALLCGGWHSIAGRHAFARGAWHWGILAGKAWAPARDWACLCTSGLRVLAQTWACSNTLLVQKSKSDAISIILLFHALFFPTLHVIAPTWMCYINSYWEQSEAVKLVSKSMLVLAWWKCLYFGTFDSWSRKMPKHLLNIY